MPQRFVAHLDMDAFYASVELLRYPELRGKPVVIGGRRRPTAGDAFTRLRDYAGRGVVTTAPYEARTFGVHSGMGLMKAARLIPDAILLPADFDEYRRYSALFKEAVRALAPHIEDRGIDEVYIELTELVTARAEEGPPDPWARARTVALDIQRAVRDATRLSCSIGITRNKLLSKIASDLDKPGGVTVLTEADIPVRVWSLPVRRVNGIGPKAAARLEGLGIRTIGELAKADSEFLVAHFGTVYGRWMHDAAHGRDERPVMAVSTPKSLSRETTFENDLHPVRDREALSQAFTGL
ncbi:MAG TPA: DNA polymerase IV, partial [Burkholderiales bacterium]|nr:DNA polymerase IV [Burkholderiales bacterium]